MITCDVDNIRGLGEGKVDGKVWTVRSIDNSHVLKGETAVIEKIEGVKLIVRERMIKMPLAIILLLIIILVIIVANIKIVPQAHSYIIERLGGYYATWGVGLHFKVPFIDRIAKKVNLKEHVVDFPPQPVITKDNVTMQIDTVVYYQITDPKLFAYGVERPMMAIENLTATTLRNIIGDLELDETLTSRDTVNTKCVQFLTRQLTHGVLRLTELNLKHYASLLKFKTQWNVR